MMTGAELLTHGPLVLIEQIASTHPKEGGVDVRAQVTLHTRDGKTWIGVPTRFIPTKDEKYVVIETHVKKSVVCLNTKDIEAVEFENLEFVVSYFERPWQRDERFRNVSRLQLQRQAESMWNFIPNPKLALALDQFPNDPDTPGALLAWLEMLKGEVETIRSTAVGAEAIKEIQQISITYGGEGLELKKQDQNLTFAITLGKESFDRSQTAKLLNDLL